MSDQERFSDPAEIRHVIGATGTFSLHNVSGDVDVRGADTDEVRVIAHSSHGNGELPLVVRRTEGGLHIEVEQKGFEIFGFRGTRGGDGIEFEVELPRSARVEINGVSSEINARGLDGEQQYRTVSGDIEINVHGGRISLTTLSGEVGLRSDQPLAADLTTTSGDVEIEAAELSNLQLKTVSGDTEIKAAFAAGPLHTVESVSGDLSLRSIAGLSVEVKRGLDVAQGGGRRLVVGDGAAQLRFRSLSGDLEVDSSTVTIGSAPAPAQDVQPIAPRVDSLEILQALERGEIDVEEASRRLEGAAKNA